MSASSRCGCSITCIRSRRYAIRYADELNFVYLTADECARRMASVRARCEREGRDPSTLRFSLYTRDEEVRATGQERIDLIGRLTESGLDRIVCFPARWSPTVDAQERFAEDCRAAGVTIAT
jgi:alkanesulfonate monooxygenase SsuD/methylene tetrahydromethanopterin reductase-like flavin-dependent oxidoreductase (luciferase family)